MPAHWKKAATAAYAAFRISVAILIFAGTARYMARELAQDDDDGWLLPLPFAVHQEPLAE